MRRFLTFMLFTLLVMGISAQDRTITGIVMDGDLDNSPLPGATVSQSGADSKVSQGTVTDYDGKFTLKVSADTKQISVRYIGYDTKTIHLVAGKDHYEVTLLPDSKQISEVVVTGYQKLDRRKLTAAVTTVKISDENIGAVNNLDQALAG